MEAGDGDILEAFRRDVEEGGRLLFGRYYRPLVLYASSLLEDGDGAEDAVQDVFYGFLKDRMWLKVEALGAYLFRCVKHGCLNRLRDRREFSHAEMLEFDAAEEEAESVSPELMEAIHRAIEELPEQTRRVVRAVVVEGRKYREAAELMEVSVNTVKRLLANGLKALRGRFKDTIFLFLVFQGEGR